MAELAWEDGLAPSVDETGASEQLDGVDLLAVLDRLFTFVGVLSPHGVLLEANRFPLEVAGLSRDQVIGLEFWECPWWNHDPQVKARLRAAIEQCGNGAAVRYEEQIWVADGGRLWIDVQLAPVVEHGTVTMIIASATDIDARTRAEAAVAASESRLRAVFNGVDQGFCLCEVVRDAEGRAVDYRFLEVNRLFETMTGLADAAGRTALELVPDLEPFWVETYGQIAAGDETVRFQQGSAVMNRTFDVCCVPLQPQGHFALVFTDVTAQERAQADLQAGALRNRFRALLTDAFRRNIDPLAVQQVACRLLAEHLGAHRVRYADIDDASALGELFADVRAGHTVVVHDAGTDPRFAAANPAATPGDGVGASVLVPLLFDGRLTAVFVVEHDEPRAWTEHEVRLIEETADRTRSAVEWARAELELRASEARFRLLADALPSPVWVHGPTGEQEWVNLTYCQYFGVERDGMIANRWTVLTHPDDTAYAEEFAACVAEHRPFDAEVRVRRADGEWRSMHSWAQPRFDGAGNYLGHVGLSADITERKMLEAADRRARRHAELLATVIAELEQTDPRPRLQRLVDVLVPEFADFATVEDPASADVLLGISHRDPGLVAILRELRQQHRLDNDNPKSVARALTAESPVVTSIDDELIAELVPDERAVALLARLGPRSHIAVPIELGRGRHGVLTAGISSPERDVFTTSDVNALASIASHAGIVVVQADLHDQEHGISLRLQQALLPQHLAQVEGVTVAGRYHAASGMLEVGGDWYDSVVLQDGRLLLVAGDVVGHGLDAAAMMGRLRAGLAALAVQHTSPGLLLRLLDDYARTPGTADFTTVCCAVLDPATGDVRYASAGHLPALVIEPDGTTRWLDAATSTPLCTSAPATRPEATTQLSPGSLLVLYTDGLVERRGERLDDNLQRLAAIASRHRHLSVDELCDELMRLSTASPTTDDTVTLCVSYHRR